MDPAVPCASPACAARSIDPHPGAAEPPPDVGEAGADASAGCNPDDVGDAEAGADGAAADDADDAGAAGVAEVTGLDGAGDEEEADEHPATPAPTPASTVAAPASTAIRLVSLLELTIANPHLRGPGAAARTMSRNFAAYTPFKDDARLATVSVRL